MTVTKSIESKNQQMLDKISAGIPSESDSNAQTMFSSILQRKIDGEIITVYDLDKFLFHSDKRYYS